MNGPPESKLDMPPLTGTSTFLLLVVVVIVSNLNPPTSRSRSTSSCFHLGMLSLLLFEVQHFSGGVSSDGGGDSSHVEVTDATPIGVYTV